MRPHSKLHQRARLLSLASKTPKVILFFKMMKDIRFQHLYASVANSKPNKDFKMQVTPRKSASLAVHVIFGLLLLPFVTSSLHVTENTAFLPMKTVSSLSQGRYRSTSAMDQSGQCVLKINNAVARKSVRLNMDKGPNNGKGNTGSGILFPPGLVFFCAVLLPNNDPLLVGTVFLVAFAAFNIYMKKNE